MTDAAYDASLTETATTDLRTRHAASWLELARRIAASRDAIDPTPPSHLRPGDRPGRLTVMGSGIDSVGFQLGDEPLLRAADHVFYCVADPATVVWLTRLRPDALDLYVLYDDTKPRYVTYMQMAESMLYHVRRGKHVVCVFYGHPGIFVLSTHRAILIARREGHQATMRAAVSALDCLCADLGVDPSHPGMHTYEATDMLVRRRVPDVRVHLVLWQVGLIGEMGFRRRGYINRNFSTFVEYLQSHYGERYPVTHYVASRYPTLAPVQETYRLDQLHDPAIQIRITGLSTFYLAPKEATPADPEMVKALGLLGPGQRVKPPRGPLRAIGDYGSREMKAFDDFATFTVPSGYHAQPDNAASRFLITLRMEPELQALYATDPAAALADPRFAGLTARDRKLLATRNAGAVQIAAKGLIRAPTTNLPLLKTLLRQRPFAAGIAAGTSPEDRRARLEAGAAVRGQTVTWGELHRDINRLNRHHLLPWSGVYASEDRRMVITLLGHSTHSRKSLLYVDDLRIRFFAFGQGSLQWRVERGNPHNGFLRLDVDRRGRRTLLGQIWPSGEARPDLHYVQADELDPDRLGMGRMAGALSKANDLTAVAGHHMVHIVGAGVDPLRTLVIDPDGTPRATLDGQPLAIDDFSNGTLTWHGGPDACATGELTFLVNPLDGSLETYGTGRAVSGARRSCYGAQLEPRPAAPPSSLPAWVHAPLRSICHRSRRKGGLLLWPKWEKFALTTRVMNALLTRLDEAGR